VKLVSEGIQASADAHFTLHSADAGHDSRAKDRLSTAFIVQHMARLLN